MSQRTNALADRLERGANALATFAGALTDAEWQTRVPKDGRKIGVVVHHVATMYPLEIQLAQILAGGQPVTGVTWAVVFNTRSNPQGKDLSGLIDGKLHKVADEVKKWPDRDLFGKFPGPAAR